ncbi:hypothetical protein KBB96_09280 [Luteolibacter ambystomatis]|uniref:DUF998 domain-containing protein n=1 Tax=Luteolibacter ambystomatis TaxID=2824561 RepID=A0A975J2X8_9BACT|nr:hypothetical protein [Luteolibacter ambystomatis]QUE53070.1 hypothetical protein KBB96_09280 [Luteolibacter ambystomatis]
MILHIMPESPRRRRLARILLWLAPALLLAALPLDWTHGYSVRWMFFDIPRETMVGFRLGHHPGGYILGPNLYTAFLASLGTILFLSAVCPWFARVLAGNAPLRWICRALAVAALVVFLAVPWPSIGRYDDVEGIYSGGVLFVLAALTNAAGLCLLSGWKAAAPCILPGADKETPAANYDEPGSH